LTWLGARPAAKAAVETVADAARRSDPPQIGDAAVGSLNYML
jgi:hypothetical protein